MSLFRREERRTIPLSAPLRDFGTGGYRYGSPFWTDSMQAALKLVPVYAATGLIADSISIMPAAVYVKTASGARKLLPTQPDLLTSPHPNPIFTRVEWLQQFCASFLLRGNAYGLVTELDANSMPAKIYWMNPDAIRVEEKQGVARYWWNEEELDPATIVHIPWYPKPGSCVGLSPIQQFKTQMETASAAAAFGSDWFKNSGVPKGHLKFSAGPLDTEQSAVAKTRFKAAVSGQDVFVSGNDWEWKALSVAPEEAQFLATIKATATEIAAIYRVSPEDIGGETGNSLTYSTLEMNQYKLQVRALQPIFTRFEAHMNRILPDGQYFKFNPDAMIRTDIRTRMEAYNVGLTAGVYTQDYVRSLEDLAPMTAKETADWQAWYGHKAGSLMAPFPNPNQAPGGTDTVAPAPVKPNAPMGSPAMPPPKAGQQKPPAPIKPPAKPPAAPAKK